MINIQRYQTAELIFSVFAGESLTHVDEFVIQTLIWTIDQVPKPFYMHLLAPTVSHLKFSVERVRDNLL